MFCITVTLTGEIAIICAILCYSCRLPAHGILFPFCLLLPFSLRLPLNPNRLFSDPGTLWLCLPGQHPQAGFTRLARPLANLVFWDVDERPGCLMRFKGRVYAVQARTPTIASFFFFLAAKARASHNSVCVHLGGQRKPPVFLRRFSYSCPCLLVWRWLAAAILPRALLRCVLLEMRNRNASFFVGRRQCTFKKDNSTTDAHNLFLRRLVERGRAEEFDQLNTGLCIYAVAHPCPRLMQPSSE